MNNSRTELPIDFEICKICGESSKPKYQLHCGLLFVCQSCQFHYLDYVDADTDLDPKIDESALTPDVIQYIETQLQSSEARFDNHIKLLQEHGGIQDMRVLDIGCGGGLFLKKARELGAEVMGLELNDERAQYCISKHQLEIVKRPIESEYWEQHEGSFDAVTLWDVIEHVNYPKETIQASARLLKPGGVLLLDTPARDAFYHRFGEFGYRLSAGRFPTFLNTMYSNHQFGHKQILSTSDMRQIFTKSNLETTTVEMFHELSFPYEFYLKRMLRSSVLAKITAPLASMFFAVFRIRNKMVVSGLRRDPQA